MVLLYEFVKTKDFILAFILMSCRLEILKSILKLEKSHLFFSRTNRPQPTLFPLGYFETKTITYKSRDNVDVPIT